MKTIKDSTQIGGSMVRTASEGNRVMIISGGKTSSWQSVYGHSWLMWAGLYSCRPSSSGNNSVRRFSYEKN